VIHRAIETPMAGTVHHIEVTCADLDAEVSPRYSNKCSEGCAEGMKMFFTPKLHGSTIHANVCAGRWELVQKLSKEWWARKAGSVLGWSEEEIRIQTDPVWAAKVRAANKPYPRAVSDYRGQTKARRGGPSCMMCGKSVDKGVDVCSQCTADNEGKPKVDAGSLDELENW
jgi:hypothetical protein